MIHERIQDLGNGIQQGVRRKELFSGDGGRIKCSEGGNVLNMICNLKQSRSIFVNIIICSCAAAISYCDGRHNCSHTSKLYLLYLVLGCAESGNETIKR